MRALFAAIVVFACSPSQATPRADTGAPPAMAAATTKDTAQQASSRSTTDQLPRTACEVISVHDGDTFRCRGDVRVRLLLIDAPEMDQPDGPVARDALRKLLPRAAVVWMEYDVQHADRYGRTLAYVWTAEHGGRLINRVMAEDGWAAAVVFPPNVRRIEEIRAAVAAARASKRGIWGATRVCEPIQHKKNRC